METNTPDGDGTDSRDRNDGVAAGPNQSGTGLEPNVAGALAYLLGIITGVVMFVVEPDDEFVRFHAAQSIVVFGIIFVASIVLSVFGTFVSIVFFSMGTAGAMIGGLISLFLSLLWLVVWIGSLALWVYLMYSAYQGNTTRIPLAAGMADRIV